MKKTITLLSALAITVSPTLALHVVSPKTQNILNKTFLKSNFAVYNTFIINHLSSYIFQFEVTLSNGTYNGFSGFINQIDTIMTYDDHRGWALYFFQWLDDDDFDGDFPGLNGHTQQGFWHPPFAWGTRLETHMGHFGSCFDCKSDTALNMIFSYRPWSTFGQHAEDRWNADIPSGNVAGIAFNFYFYWGRDPSGQNTGLYTSKAPTFNIIFYP